MIYNNFFGFNEEPFGVTPDPKFLYLSRKHEDAIAHILYGIKHDRGFIMLTGEVGSGKTTIIRHILDSLGPDVRTAMILNPRMNALELLKFINHDFGLKVRPSATHKSLMEELYGFLLGCHHDGGKAVVAIDEAQELSPECLEFVRLLSNLETDTKKLMQVVLVGQPELRDIIRQQSLRQLDQRIAVRYHLEPLKPEETAEYLSHRLRVAGSIGVGFPEKGVKFIHGYSGGVPRLINLSADRTLMMAYADGTTAIRPATVKAAVEDLREREGAGNGSALRPALTWAAILLIFLFTSLGIIYSGSVLLKKIGVTTRSPRQEAPRLKLSGSSYLHYSGKRLLLIDKSDQHS